MAVKSLPETPQSKSWLPTLHPVRYILAIVDFCDFRGGIMATSESALEPLVISAWIYGYLHTDVQRRDQFSLMLGS